MLRACTVVRAVQKGFCVTNDCMEPFQVLTVGVEILGFVTVSVSEGLDLAAVAVSLDGCTLPDRGFNKMFHGRPLHVRHNGHFQELRPILCIFGYADNNALVSSCSASLTLDLGTKIGIIQFDDTSQHVLFLPVIHSPADANEHIPGGFIGDIQLAGQSAR